MTKEEKAKAYDEALKKAKKELNTCGSQDCDAARQIFRFFPELKKSKDEGIRKAIHIYLDWLDGRKDCAPRGEYSIRDMTSWIEKQGEQKSTDNVEPKFHKGDWIISDTVNKDYHICKIIGIKDGNYTIESIYGYKGYNQFDEFDNVYRLWTIQEAKDGDVLLFEGYYNSLFFEGYYNSIVLFYGIGINGKGRINYHCKCDIGNYSFGIQGNAAYLGTIDKNANDYHPATKEQRDTFFAKMKEAGYEWDAEKKELNKIEKQGEQKPADNVESKFKIGDWITTVNDEGDIAIEKVVEFMGNKVRLVDTDGVYMQCPQSWSNHYHLWTIQDANDGDVLCGHTGDEYPWIGIFHELNDDDTFKSYCFLQAGITGIFCPPSGVNIFNKRNVDNHSLNVVPATKEQCDLLFSKMKESGYEWDAEKKELKKIEKQGEQKPAWSEENEKMIRSICCYLNEFGNWLSDKNDEKSQSIYKACDWLKSLKPQPKQEWSEEDKTMLNSLITVLCVHKDLYGKYIHWLYELHPKLHWKPSDEQINALDSTLQYSQVSCNSFEYLNSLFNDLKKLK